MNIKTVPTLLLITITLWLAQTTKGQEDFSFSTVTINEYNLQPEGFQYTPTNGFLMSSVKFGQVNQLLDGNGDVTTFGNCPHCTSILGLACDTNRGLVYACDTGAVFGEAKSPIGGVATYNETNGAFINYFNFTRYFNTSLPKLINGVTYDSKGNIYATDSYNGNIYIGRPDGSSGLFVASKTLLAPQDALGLGANGVDHFRTANGSEYLIVVRSGLTTAGLVRINTFNASDIVEINIKYNNHTFAEPEIFDGCVYDHTTDLLFVVGNLNHMVYEFSSTDDWLSCTLVRVANVSYANPASITISTYDDQIYVNCLNGFVNGAFLSGPYYLQQIDGLNRKPLDFYNRNHQHDHYYHYRDNSSNYLSTFSVIVIVLISCFM